MVEGPQKGRGINVDYDVVPLPDHNDYPEYDFRERRRAILNLIKEKGSPLNVKQVKLARMFDVSEVMISKDMDVLAEWYEENMGGRASWHTDTVFSSAEKEVIETATRFREQALKKERKAKKLRQSGNGERAGEVQGEANEFREKAADFRERAARLRRDWESWAGDRGVVEKAPEKNEHTFKVEYETLDAPDIEEEEFLIMEDE